MNPLTSLKKAPRWAWITVGGVVIGAVAVKMYQGRDAEEPAEDAGVGTGEVGTNPPIGSAPGIVVPPVIMPTSDGGSVVGLDLVTGIVGDLTSGWEAMLGPLIGNQAAINQTVVEAIANAGGPPGLTQSNPTVINQPVNVTSAPKPAAPPKPCCKYDGHPLSWWRNPANARNSKGKWKWPGSGYTHTEPFRGNKACDGGGSAGGSKREC